jgi:hypothetical protein
MEQPRRLLIEGTRVRTHEVLESTNGMMVNPLHLSARKPNAEGVVEGCVPGHGGDVYWVRHEGDDVAATYCFTEFELVEK